MKRLLTALMLVSLLAVAIPVSSQGGVQPLEPQTPPPVVYGGDFVDETPDTWFVQLASPPGVDGTPPGFLKKEKDGFRNAAAKAGLQFTERYAFDTLWNGLSVKINPADLGKLARIPGVTALYPVVAVSLPEPTDGEELDLYTALAMTGADVAQSELGFTGAGIKVAVMDTGIDYDHPDLGGCFGEGCRVAYGYDLVGDAFNADSTSPSYNPIPVPDDDPDDCQGHGTHVSGIVGANGTVTGVAPGVTFGAYRVFGCEGSTTADIMIAAMEMALADDMDVLNMSIGSAYQWPQYPTAVASDKLVNTGMVVVASIGNNGANGLYSAGAPGLGEKVIGVASFDNTHVLLPYFTVNEHKVGYVTMTFSGPVPTSGTEEIVYIGRACNIDLPLLADPSGKVALAERGACSFNEKATNAINAGATGVVIHNNAPGVFNGTLGTPIDGVTPVVGISLEDGLFIRAQTPPIMMTWTDQMDMFPSPTGGLISSFSSYGLSPDLALKPDIGAPGGNIYSTYPLEKGGYATMGGTSMSSPHVAGAVALLLQAKPNTPSQAVRGILQNSADPKPWWGNPGLGFLDNVHRQGAGMLDIDDAILATTKIEPGKIATGEGEAGPYTQKLTIENNGDKGMVYDLSYANALSTGGVITPSFWGSDAYVEFNKAFVSIPPGGTASVNATIYPATGPEFGQYGGYIVLTPRDGGQVYRVPFAGFVGDYQGIQVLTPGSLGFPLLGVLYQGSYYLMPEGGWVFAMQDDFPAFLVHFEHQPEKFRVEIFAEKGKAWHRAYDEEYLPRNSTSTGFYGFPFDGTTFAGKKTYTVPDGTYYAVISVLKANGDDNNPAHWETWTSPMFVIDRP
ncbi:MAG: S8 family serine peptidase [Anaerolineae bacterium]|nr:S8 family serine peptidase [Anaerolineae bacterium]